MANQPTAMSQVKIGGKVYGVPEFYNTRNWDINTKAFSDAGLDANSFDFSNWDAIKDEVMYRAVRRKFELHGDLRTLLLATGEEDIVEAAPTDYYWGVGREGTGQNKLGKILERIRAELRAKTPPVGG